MQAVFSGRVYRAYTVDPEYFQTFMGIAVPYTLINVLLNSIPVFIGLKFIGKEVYVSVPAV